MKRLLPLLFTTACDDTQFNHGAAAVDGSGYSAVVQVFDESCLGCHSAASAFGGLDLETDPCVALVDAPASGADYGGDPLVVPGDHEGSVLWNKVADTGAYGGVMPQGVQLVQENIDLIAAWIDDDAPCDN